MPLPEKMRTAEGRLLDIFVDHVRTQHPDLADAEVQRRARQLYEGPSRPSPLGPVGLHWRDVRDRRIMADIEVRSSHG